MRHTVRRIAVVGELDVEVAEALREAGIRLERVRGSSPVGLARELLAMKPAAVHARTAHVRTALVTRLLDIPLVVEAGRDDVNASTARAARMAARTLCGGAAVREALLQLGAPVHKTHVLRSLLDVEDDGRDGGLFPPVLDPALRWVVAASPCDAPDRGHGDLMLAFASIARERHALRLLIAGDGPEAARLRQRAMELGLASRVVVHPVPLEQLAGLFAHAAVVAAPSRNATLPDPVPEALAAGAPVVAVATGPHPTWIREGRTGFLVPERNPGALAVRIAQLLDHPDLARRIGDQARAAARELATPRLIALDLARCYAAIARRRPQPAPIWLPAPART